jgi:cation diffusion facilitator family transporter
MAAQQDSNRAIWYALGANLAVMAAKAAGAFYTGSGALLAESLHSLADSGNQILLLWGVRRSQAPPSPDHPLGHGREVYFWSFLVALMLFSMGGLLSIYEGVHKLAGHDGVRDPWIAIGIVVFALVAEAISLRAALRQSNRLRGRRSLWRWLRETRRSDLLVVVSEDSAALAGLAVALAALLATLLTSDPFYDALGSIAIGVLLVLVALGLSIEIKSLLVGESASPMTRATIREFLEGCPPVRAVRALVPLQHGPDVIVLARLALHDGPATQLGAATEACKRGLHDAVPEVSVIYVELELPTDDAEVPPIPERSRRPDRTHAR